MNDDSDNLSTNGAPEPAANAAPESPVDAAILEAAKAAIVARGGQTRAMTVMSYPAPLLNDLMERLADHRVRVDATLVWLEDECLARQLDAPSKSALYRFASLVREEYRLAFLADKRQQAERLVGQMTGGDPESKQIALTHFLTEQLTDELMRAQDRGGAIDSKTLGNVIAGTRIVTQNVFDKKKMDARIAALAKTVEHRDVTIALLNQRLLEAKQKFEAAVQAVKDKSHATKRAITDDDIAEVRKAVFG